MESAALHEEGGIQPPSLDGFWKKQESVNRKLSFTLSGGLLGARRTIPLALGDLAFSISFGVLARQAGLTLTETLLVNGLVFAGAAQVIAVGLWTTPLPILLIIFTTLVVNLRYLLMGAAIRPYFSRLPALKVYGSVFLMTDETWALTMKESIDGGRDGAFLLGSGLMLWTAGSIGTAVGYLVGAVIQDPVRWGLDFVFVALFITLVAGLWRGKSDLLPWGAAALVALAAAQWLPGKWYILLGGLVGSAIGALRDAS